MRRVQLNVWGAFSRSPTQGQRLRADLQKVTGEEHELSGANPSKLPQALYSRDLLRRGSSCCKKPTALAVVVSGLAQYPEQRSDRDPQDMAQNKTWHHPTQWLVAIPDLKVEQYLHPQKIPHHISHLSITFGFLFNVFCSLPQFIEHNMLL